MVPGRPSCCELTQCDSIAAGIFPEFPVTGGPWIEKDPGVSSFKAFDRSRARRAGGKTRRSSLGASMDSSADTTDQIYVHPDRPAPNSPRLLVVDDEENVATIVGELLRNDGYEVDIALSGDDAI